MGEAIDPPIIISGGGDEDHGGGGGGGGGGSSKPSIKTRNVITIDCDPENPQGPRRFRTKVNRDAEIRSVTIDFPGMANQDPIEISGYNLYKIRVTFNTAPASQRRKPRKAAAARKGKKAAAKRPVARKKSS